MNAPKEISETIVTVEAPARLHLGFVDLQREQGRCFGSLGLALDGIGTRIVAQPADDLRAGGPLAARAQAYLRALHDRFRLSHGIKISVLEATPEHAGLGTGTQLALAVGAAVARLTRAPWSAREIAGLLDRGARSGIGLGAFSEGGFLIDGGRDADGAPPAIVSRIEFPAQWRVLLIFDSAQRGLYGTAETAAFRALPELARGVSAELCRLALTRVMPGIAAANMDEFGPALAQIQQVVGDHFAQAQGGRFSSAAVAEVLGWLEAEGVSCVGQSSWGPTGFAIVDSQARGEELMGAVRGRWPPGNGLSLRLVRGRNRGASVELSLRHSTSTI
jgi:beta-ribofuranosylaminobenzene 5'-phosphate synthase